MNVTGDRTAEHGLATVGYDDEGVAAQSWDMVRGRHARRLPARPADRAADGPRALQRLRLRRLARTCAGPADGERLAAAGAGRAVHRGADLRGRARHLRRRRPLLVDRHAALQLPVHRPAVLPHRERPAGRAAAGRRLPGDHHRLLGLDGARSAARRPTSWAAPSTAARPSRARSRRSRTAAPRPCSGASTS